IRKILSHTVCVVLNKKLDHSPIQLEKLILS
ncbi:IS982 family transposase, partial [Acinetobacter pseudolwoffii]